MLVCNGRISALVFSDARGIFFFGVLYFVMTTLFLSTVSLSMFPRGKEGVVGSGSAHFTLGRAGASLILIYYLAGERRESRLKNGSPGFVCLGFCARLAVFCGFSSAGIGEGSEGICLSGFADVKEFTGVPCLCGDLVIFFSSDMDMEFLFLLS